MRMRQAFIFVTNGAPYKSVWGCITRVLRSGEIINACAYNVYQALCESLGTVRGSVDAESQATPD